MVSYIFEPGRDNKIRAKLLLGSTYNHPVDFLFNDEEQLECVLASKSSAHFGSETIIEQGPYNTIGTGGSSHCFIRMAFFQVSTFC